MRSILIFAYIAIFVVLSISIFAYTVQKCGLGTTMILGNGATYAAVSGLCEESN